MLVVRPAAGKSFCYMAPGTAAKHDKLLTLAAKQHNGWQPVVSGPDDAYRNETVQQRYWDTMPPGMAAYPRTSSHGLEYEGRDHGAVDYGNWADIGRTAWFALLREAGFIPGYFNGTNGPDEPWHAMDPTPWTVPTSNKEIKVKTRTVKDALARSKGRRLAPGASFYLHTDQKAPTSNAVNVAAASGQNSLTGHIYAKGLDGDGIEAAFVWQDVKTKPKPKQSGNYIHDIHIGSDGHGRAGFETKRAVSKNHHVYLRITAKPTNRGPVTISIADVDAWVFQTV